MNIAYLTNCYPAVSHTFIRREIEQLERDGHRVVRLSVRPPRTELVDERDKAELQKTICILDTGAVALLLATVSVLLARPAAWVRAFRRACQMKRSSSRSWLRHAAYLAEACWLLRRCDWSNVDHLHVHFGTNATDIAVLLSCLNGVRFSFTVHGPDEFDDPRGYNLREKVEAAHFVVGISQYGRAQIQRWLPLELWGKVHVIHCSVDERYLTDPPASSENSTLLCVGRLSAQKGHGILIDAAVQLASQGVLFNLILAGDGELRDVLETRITRHGLGDRIRITGWVNGSEVRSLLRESRAFVLPSFAEGLPVVIMEALAMERPVISTYVAGIPELVRNGESGWLVTAGDVPALAAAMREALEASPEQLDEMGRAGRKAVLERHHVHTETRKLAKLFEAASIGQPVDANERDIEAVGELSSTSSGASGN